MFRKYLVLSIEFPQGYRQRVQRPSEIRGTFSAWNSPLMGRRTCAVSWRKLLWEDVSLAMCSPFKVQHGNLSWFEVTGKQCDSILVSRAWATRSPTGRRKGHQEGEGSNAECGEMSATLCTSFLQAGCKTRVLLCCIQKSLRWVLCVIPNLLTNI